MKQTVEEAARENILFNHRTVDRTLFGKDLAKFGEMNFPWIFKLLVSGMTEKPMRVLIWKMLLHLCPSRFLMIY